MQFTDLIFLFAFLPLLLAVYYLLKPKYRPIVLVIFSLLFYACGSADFFFLLVIAIFADVMLGSILFKVKQQDKKTISKALLVTGIVLNLAILGYYKYSNFAITNINNLFGLSITIKTTLLPLGLSFFAFKSISYLADIYTGKITQPEIMQSINYLSFFGQIQSGPVSRYNSFSITLDKKGLFSEGVVRFILGFGKKIIIADVLSKIVIEIFDKTGTLSTSLAWLGSVCYSLQLFYDFSGYSDMAIGISNMLGYSCPENFNYPYISKSISEFWRRWHITLGAWFRDYVYIPLGGSRSGKLRLFINLFIVWLLTGLWHGAGWNFIAWGLGYFVLIAFEKATGFPDRLPGKLLKTLYRVISLLLVNFLWVLFRSADLSDGVLFIKTMCSAVHNSIPTARALFLLKDYGVFIAVALLFSMPVIGKLKTICYKNKISKAVFDIVFAASIICILIIALSFIISGQNSPFLYGNF